jgi:hypothetical protein
VQLGRGCAGHRGGPEALALGSKAGVAPERVVEVLSSGLAANKVLEVKGEKFLSHDFAPGGKVEYHRIKLPSHKRSIDTLLTLWCRLCGAVLHPCILSTQCYTYISKAFLYLLGNCTFSIERGSSMSACPKSLMKITITVPYFDTFLSAVSVYSTFHSR